jgi:quinol monooxygenase YgiN
MYAVVTETSNDPSQRANVANLDRELQSFLDQQPGCRGYLMIDKDDGGHVSIILWESKEIWDTAIHTEAHDQLLVRIRPLLTSRPALYRGSVTTTEFKPVESSTLTGLNVRDVSGT